MTLNLVRSTWTRVRFGDVVRRVREQGGRDSHERYVGGSHLESGVLKVSRWGDTHDGMLGSTFTYVFHPGQVIFVSARPYLQKIGVPDFSGLVADKTYVLEAALGSGLLQEFLPFLLLSDSFQKFASTSATGSMNPRLLWSAMQRYEFDLPPLDEQHRIASLLWAVEDHRTTCNLMLDRVRSAKSRFTTERLRRGTTEDGWPIEPVGAIVTSGPANGRSAPANDQQRGVPTLSISAIRGGQVLGGDSVKWTDVDPASVAAFQVQPDDFLIVRGNGNKSMVGLGGLVTDGLPQGCIYPDLLIRLRFNKERMLPSFAAEQWNNALFHSALLSRAKSTNGIWKVNGQDIRSHELVVPPIQAQREVLAQLEVFDSAMASLVVESSELLTTRASVYSRVFGDAL